MDIKNADDTALDRELERHLKAIDEIKAEQARRRNERLDNAWDDVINSIKAFIDLSENGIEIYNAEHTIHLSYGEFEDNGCGCIRAYD